MSSPAGRTVTPLISRIRNFMAGRKIMEHQRFEQTISPRTQPPPNIPGGIAHHLSHNNYFLRDGRRIANAPTNSYSSSKLISAVSEEPSTVASRTPRPGAVYNWD
ncbi:DgyrCDS1138 [Dimorphilus gyrociliatus]|uniref:NADH dehydrogenase [ubiquinone] 1 alpha subcomplex subunit 7 n=1 Tax=Dimorphilus gyrociliatus TaxID=2664684 RepID=A0A7I8V6D9_9ANNE|nr:DgyrCDS1138 [Dimorphilus gyrociliatus]